jgi:hypothetical protein
MTGGKPIGALSGVSAPLVAIHGRKREVLFFSVPDTQNTWHKYIMLTSNETTKPNVYFTRKLKQGRELTTAECKQHSLETRFTM